MLLFLKNLIFTVLVPGTVAAYVPYLILTRTGRLEVGWGAPQVLAFVPWLIGAAIYARCVWDFAVTGRGTPAPIDAPTRLVVEGLYRYVRNPMYVGVLLVILGWVLFFGSWPVLTYGCAVWLAFHSFVVFYEEPTLRRRFGASYSDYCQAVGRWIPGRRYDPAR